MGRKQVALQNIPKHKKKSQLACMQDEFFFHRNLITLSYSNQNEKNYSLLVWEEGVISALVPRRGWRHGRRALKTRLPRGRGRRRRWRLAMELL